MIDSKDIIARQMRSSQTGYSDTNYGKPLVNVPIVYEDDYFAIVNKPSGMITYSHSKGGFSNNSILRVMPHLLTRPSRDTTVEDVLDFPAACHRLDVATSGCLVVAKTKQAAVHFADQFASRKVKKTYTAILNGRPLTADANSPHHKSPSAHLLKKMGLLSPNNNNGDDHILASEWRLIDYPIENKDAVTLWRELQVSKSLKALNQTLTLVEFHPLHGRKHQLRRHASLVLGCPIAGDELYDDGSEGSVALRDKKDKIFLCSNEIVVEHPYYNTEQGRIEFQSGDPTTAAQNTNYTDSIREGDDGIIRVHARIDVPPVYTRFLAREERKLQRFMEENDAS
eukprot:scaffold96532_cov43-Attheya_sp.AAC.3